MPSVADELAALRAGGGVKARAAGLDKGAGLSTPEAEEAALKAKREQDKLGKASAREILSKGGSGAASQELEHSLQQKAKKKAEQDKINEARKSLSKGSSYAASTSPDAPAPQAPKEKETANDVAAVAAAVIEVEDVDDDVPELEEADDIPELDGGIQQTTGDAESRQVTNRNEKKARKLMQRLGMNPVSGIERATFKTGGQSGYFFIDNPDVYTMGKTYVIFGEARQGGNMQQAAMAQAQAQAAMAQQQQQQAAGMMPSVAEEGVEVEELPEIVEDSVDESGVDDKDIILVMSQASCSRPKAVKALKENDNDLVNAIMSLTT
ncbi:nascent polypeptide-associated complex subunit alpha [Skeletonema marinoi]|uniref:Nascent polypeptide-associated complex subunit alpha n=1 Tax=Skeletonema marinoi TaxID=267567 RepID=A0AAD8YAJ6_9STRA|nr:nascent polypeptide-associated complex subunit alpha [Skeletonema marinoi]